MIGLRLVDIPIDQYHLSNRHSTVAPHKHPLNKTVRRRPLSTYVFTLPLRVTIDRRLLDVLLSVILIMRRRGGPSRDDYATGTHSMRSRISLPLHTHICILTVVPSKIYQKGRADAPSHPDTSLSLALNSCHARRTGCPPDEYSRHSSDCLTHIWTLGIQNIHIST